jgi:NAD(P)H-dependent flavin oxidoreductase YrpB (nitropropane dioxygenase family)
MSGQIAGLVKRRMPAREIMETMMAQAERLVAGDYMS